MSTHFLVVVSYIAFVTVLVGNMAVEWVRMPKASRTPTDNWVFGATVVGGLIAIGLMLWGYYK